MPLILRSLTVCDYPEDMLPVRSIHTAIPKQNRRQRIQLFSAAVPVELSNWTVNCQLSTAILHLLCKGSIMHAARLEGKIHYMILVCTKVLDIPKKPTFGCILRGTIKACHIILYYRKSKIPRIPARELAHTFHENVRFQTHRNATYMWRAALFGAHGHLFKAYGPKYPQ